MIIVDTNVVSELRRPAPDMTVVGWFARQPEEDLFLTAVSEAELRYGIEILPAGQRRTRLAMATERMLQQ